MMALLPWWAGVIVALVGYVVLHRWARPVAPSALQPGSIATTAVRSAGESIDQVELTKARIEVRKKAIAEKRRIGRTTEATRLKEHDEPA